MTQLYWKTGWYLYTKTGHILKMGPTSSFCKYQEKIEMSSNKEMYKKMYDNNIIYSHQLK